MCSEVTEAQLPAACGKKAAEGTATQGHRCHHPAGGEHSASTGTQLKMKMSLDVHQGASDPVLEPNSRPTGAGWDCFTGIPRLESRTCSLLGRSLSSHTPAYQHASYKPNAGPVKVSLQFFLPDTDMRVMITGLGSPRRCSLCH